MTPREEAICWAFSVAQDPRAVVLDTETLSLRPEDGICDLAIVAMSGQVVFDSLIDPGRPIPADATAIHGIADADVVDAPTWGMVYPDVRTVLSGRRVIVYNAAFDAAVLDACCDTADLPALGGASWECAMRAYSDFDGTPNTNRRRPGPKWWRLGEACKRMGITLDGAHRARADAEATRRLVVAMAGICPLDTEDGYQPEGRCSGCGGAWIMGEHVHPNELAEIDEALDYPDEPSDSEPAESGQLSIFDSIVPDARPVRDWTR